MSEEQTAKIPEPVIEAVRSAHHIVLLTHVHPDGDALGASLGFAEILEGLGKNVFFFVEEPVSYLFDFLPGKDRASTSIEALQSFIAECGGEVLTVSLDAGDSARLGKYEEIFLEQNPFLVIDHHRSHKNFGDIRWIEPDRSSTGEMIYELACQLGADISYEASANLYVAICSDTGSFRYDSTQSRTLEIAADLVGRGVKPEVMARHLYENISLPRLSLLRRVLSTLELHCDGQLAFIHVTDKMIDETSSSPDDVEGFVDYPRSLDTVKVAVFIKALKPGKISVSLRAKGDCDVSGIAEKFCGGGHKNAAGCWFGDRSMEEVKSLVLEELCLQVGCTPN